MKYSLERINAFVSRYFEWLSNMGHGTEVFEIDGEYDELYGHTTLDLEWYPHCNLIPEEVKPYLEAEIVEYWIDEQSPDYDLIGKYL